MLDSIYHIKFKLFCDHVFRVKTSSFCQIATLLWASFIILKRLVMVKTLYLSYM